MKKVKYKFLVMAILFVIPMVWLVPVSALAEGSAAEEQKYYLGSAVNAGTDTGYSESNDIKENDPHFGWELGRFYISKREKRVLGSLMLGGDATLFDTGLDTALPRPAN